MGLLDKITLTATSRREPLPPIVPVPGFGINWKIVLDAGFGKPPLEGVAANMYETSYKRPYYGDLIAGVGELADHPPIATADELAELARQIAHARAEGQPDAQQAGLITETTVETLATTTPAAATTPSTDDTPAPAKRGRPPGAKNKPKADAQMSTQGVAADVAAEKSAGAARYAPTPTGVIGRTAYVDGERVGEIVHIQVGHVVVLTAEGAFVVHEMKHVRVGSA